MGAGVALIFLGGLTFFFSFWGNMSDFHLFAAFNIMGIGAICCVIAHHGGRIYDQITYHAEWARRRDLLANPPSGGSSGRRPK